MKVSRRDGDAHSLLHTLRPDLQVPIRLPLSFLSLTLFVHVSRSVVSYSAIPWAVASLSIRGFSGQEYFSG